MSSTILPWRAVVKYPVGALVLYSSVIYHCTTSCMNVAPGGSEWEELGTLISTSGGVVDATTTVKGIASFAATDFEVSSGAVSLDYANGQAATGSVKGYLTAADWTTFNAKQPALSVSLTPTRALDTNYTNGARPLLVIVSFVATITGGNGVATAQMLSDSATTPTTPVTAAVGIADGSNGNIHNFSMSVVIAASLKYRLSAVQTSGTVVLSSWQEVTL